MDAGLFIHQADRLVESARLGQQHPNGLQGAAADVRTAISRAYYHALHAAFGLLDDLGYKIPKTGAAHELAKSALNHSGNKDLEKAGSDLGTLATDRRRADYDLDDVNSERIEVGEKAVRMAKAVYTTIGMIRLQLRRDAVLKDSLIRSIDAWVGTNSIKFAKK